MSEKPLLRRLRRATARRSAADREWRAEVIGAYNRGLSAIQIAEATGLSRQRVHQILTGG